MEKVSTMKYDIITVGGGLGGSGGLVARIRDAASNPANRFVLLFLIYLGALAYLYPRAAIRYADVINSRRHVPLA